MASSRLDSTGSLISALSNISMQASVVAAFIRAAQTSRDAPQRAAWAQSSSVRQSAVREWVFMTPPASLTSLPMWPTSTTSSKWDAAAISIVSPMKFEVLTTGIFFRADIFSWR